MHSAEELKVILDQLIPWLRRGGEFAGALVWLTPNKNDDVMVAKAKAVIAVLDQLRDSPQSLALLADILNAFSVKLASGESVTAVAGSSPEYDPIGVALRDSMSDVLAT